MMLLICLIELAVCKLPTYLVHCYTEGRNLIFGDFNNAITGFFVLTSCNIEGHVTMIGVRFPDFCPQRTMFRLVLRCAYPETEMYVKF